MQFEHQIKRLTRRKLIRLDAARGLSQRGAHRRRRREHASSPCGPGCGQRSARGLELASSTPRARNHWSGHASQLRHCKAETTARRPSITACRNTSESPKLGGIQMHIHAALDLLGQTRDLKVMRSKEREGPHCARQLVRDCPCERQPSRCWCRARFRPSESGSGSGVVQMWRFSLISTMKVERPPARSSAAPMRVKILSMGPISARVAGTKLPIWASTAISAVWRM